MTNPILRGLLFCLLLATNLSAQEVRQEEIPLRNDSIHIPGTLTYPTGEGALPLVVYIHGSGNIDRDGNQPGTFVQAGYIKALRKALNREGIAFFSYDKRTAVEANLPYLDRVSLTDYVSDARKALDYFENDPRFSGVHLIGHSQGSLVGMLASSAQVRSFTSLAGPALPIDSILVRQLSAQNPDLGREARPILAKLKRGESLELSEASPVLQLLLAPASRPLWSSWMAYDPREELARVNAPVLLLFGGMDTQVPEETGLGFRETRPDAQWVVLPQMNHVLKQVTTPETQQQAYTDPGVPLAEGLVEALIAFITQSN